VETIGNRVRVWTRQPLKEKREQRNRPWPVEVFSLTVRTRIIGPEARTLELPLLVRPGSFFFLFCLNRGLRGSVFTGRSLPYPREGISDILASGPIIRVLTVLQTVFPAVCNMGVSKSVANRADALSEVEQKRGRERKHHQKKTKSINPE